MTAPGWYPDPQQPAQLRWFDGQQWSVHTQPPIPPAYAPAVQQPGFAPMVQTTYINSAPQKSVGLALLLTFFFGPLGMLYSTVVGGLVMLGLDIVLGALTFGLWFIIAWPLQMVWAAVAASESRNTSSTHVAMNYPQQAYMAPAYPQQPMYPQQPTIVQPGLQIPAPPHQTQRAYQDAPTQPPAPGQSTPPEAAWYQAALTPGEIVDAEIVYETQRRYPR